MCWAMARLISGGTLFPIPAQVLTSVSTSSLVSAHW